MNGQNARPLRLGVAGVSHGHLAEVTRRADRGDFVIVGVYEADQQIRENNGLRRKVDGALFYAGLEEMLDQTKPEAVVAYGSIYDHLSVVEACAPRGIHVMVEKPLAVNTEHAARMAELAGKHKIRPAKCAFIPTKRRTPSAPPPCSLPATIRFTTSKPSCGAKYNQNPPTSLPWKTT